MPKRSRAHTEDVVAAADCSADDKENEPVKKKRRVAKSKKTSSAGLKDDEKCVDGNDNVAREASTLTSTINAVTSDESTPKSAVEKPKTKPKRKGAQFKDLKIEGLFVGGCNLWNRAKPLESKLRINYRTDSLEVIWSDATCQQLRAASSSGFNPFGGFGFDFGAFASQITAYKQLDSSKHFRKLVFKTCDMAAVRTEVGEGVDTVNVEMRVKPQYFEEAKRKGKRTHRGQRKYLKSEFGHSACVFMLAIPRRSAVGPKLLEMESFKEVLERTADDYNWGDAVKNKTYSPLSSSSEL